MSHRDPAAPAVGSASTEALPPFPDSVSERQLDGTLTLTLQPLLVDERAVARRQAEAARVLAGAPGADSAAAAALADRLEESGRAEMQALNSMNSATAFRESLLIREAAAQAAPHDPAAIRGLCGSLLGLANALDDGGMEKEARARFEELLALRRRVVELLPQEPLARLQLAHALWRVGLFEHQLTYRPSAAARARHEESLALLDHPWPDGTSASKALRVRCQNLEALAQDALADDGDLDRAEALVLQLLPLARQAAEAAPGVPRGEHPTAGLSGLADRLAGSPGRPEAQLRLTREQIEDLREDLRQGERDPRLVARLGELLLTLAGLEGQGHHREEAIRLLEQATVLRAEAALEAPLAVDRREALFKALQRLRRVGALAGAPAPWRGPLDRLTAAWREVVSAGSPPPGLRQALGRALEWLGDPEASGWFTAARNEEERGALEALLATPGDHGRQDGVLDHQRRRAKEALDRSEPDGARLALAAALEFWRELASRHPGAAGAARGLLLAHLALARLEVRLGRVEAAWLHFEPAIQATREQIAAGAQGIRELPTLASLLAEVAAAASAGDPAERWLERLRELGALRLDVLARWGEDQAACLCASGTLYHQALAARRLGLLEEARQARARGHAAGAWLIEQASCFRGPAGGPLYVGDALERWTWPPRPIALTPTEEELGWLAEELPCPGEVPAQTPGAASGRGPGA